MCKIFVLFMIYSIIGWVYETLFCSITTKKWDNRGMLIGPYCPIYGTGAILDILICGDTNEYWKVFLICMIGSAFLEYITSYSTEKLFGAVWWDYSDLPLNIHGRICLFCSIGFGIAGIIVRFLLNPHIEPFIDKISSGYIDVISLLLMALFAADIALTADSLIHINQKLLLNKEIFDDKISEKYDVLIEGIENSREIFIGKADNVKEKIVVTKKYSEKMDWRQKRLIRTSKKNKFKDN